MRRGIGFVVNSVNDKFLCKIPSCMDVDHYDWMIDDVTNMFDPGRPKGRYNGAEFRKMIEKERDYNFVRIRRYPVNAVIEDLQNYEDYLNSECSFALICTDGGFYELYIKDEKGLEALETLCKNLGFVIDYITDENDARYWFHGC